MTRLLMLVEGQTEEAFVNKTLSPYLATRGVYIVRPTILRTGRKHKGGAASWDRIRSNLRELQRDKDANISTMFDFCDLHKDFPGWDEIQGSGDVYDKVKLLEKRFEEELNDRRFIPYLSLHEFEALVFSSPDVVADHFGYPKLSDKLKATRVSAGSPELIDGDWDTHPKRRLERLLGEQSLGYGCAKDGPVILEKIGIEAIRSACQHFNDWLKRLESLG